jgi:ubiquinone biosynthesis protein UbiJ
MLEALARGRFGTGGLEVEGDEVTLAEFADILRCARPDFEPSLGQLLGPSAAQSLVGLLELGFESAVRFAREIGAESRRLARSGAAQRFLCRAELEDLAARRQAAALAIDRIAARIDVLEQAARESP